MKNKNGFPERLRELRQKINLSQTEFGKKAGLHYTHISRYERGLSKPSAEKLKNMAEVLGVTTDYLIEGKINEVAQTRLEDRDLLDMFKEVENFKDEDKTVIKKVIYAFISMKKIEKMAGNQ